MVRYYCDRCDELLSSKKYSMQVLRPDGEKLPVRHYCVECWSLIAKKLSEKPEPVVSDEDETDNSPDVSAEPVSSQADVVSKEEDTEVATIPDIPVRQRPVAKLSSAEQVNKPAVSVRPGINASFFFKEEDSYEILDRRVCVDILRQALAYMYTHKEESLALIAKRVKMTYQTITNWHKKYYSSGRSAKIDEITSVSDGKDSVKLSKVLILAAAGRDSEWIASEFSVNKKLISLVVCYFTGVVTGYDSVEQFIADFNSTIKFDSGDECDEEESPDEL